MTTIKTPTLAPVQFCADCGRRVTVLNGAFVAHGKLTANGKFVACVGSGKHPVKVETK